MRIAVVVRIGLALSALALPAIAAAAVKPGKGVTVQLNTDAGAIVVQVFPKVAPLSACDFLDYVASNLYKGATFYRTVRLDNDHGVPKIEVLQGGLSDDSSPRPPIAHESTEMTGLKHVDGAISLARGAVGTGGAGAFFIVINDQPGLDYGATRNKDGQGFAVFGRVVKGMDVVRKIHMMDANAKTDDAYMQGQLLTKPVVIQSAKRLGKAPKECSKR